MSAPQALGALVEAVAALLRAGGIEAPRREARALVGALCGEEGAALYDRDRLLSARTAEAVLAAARRRAAREPLARILGRREFWSLSFALNAATLVPRPDSETLVETGLSLLSERDGAYRLLDLGCGSGCLLLALLSERPAAWGLGIDLAVGAARQAADNAGTLGLAARAAFVAGDWGGPLAGGFDLIVSNPPYIESAVLADLEPEVVAHDPRLALDGGRDGLAAYRRLIPVAADLLNPGAALALEVGASQADGVTNLCLEAGLTAPSVTRDLAGIARVVSVRKKALGRARRGG
ncbi:MAG: peptide chain release factor N(5)-glutamine methyltransferase [Rhodospirillales bacterium]